MRILFLLLTLISLPAVAVTDKVGVRTQVAYSATTTSTQALAYNGARSYLLVQNQGTVSVIVKFMSAQGASEGIVIVAGGNYEPIRVPMDAMYIKSVSGTQTVEIIEGE